MPIRIKPVQDVLIVLLVHSCASSFPPKFPTYDQKIPTPCSQPFCGILGPTTSTLVIKSITSNPAAGPTKTQAQSIIREKCQKPPKIVSFRAFIAPKKSFYTTTAVIATRTVLEFGVVRDDHDDGDQQQHEEPSRLGGFVGNDAAATPVWLAFSGGDQCPVYRGRYDRRRVPYLARC